MFKKEEGGVYTTCSTDNRCNREAYGRPRGTYQQREEEYYAQRPPPYPPGLTVFNSL